ncbi:hypothetical protein CW731_14665 [Polaribacter sp. ALD11]|uniref:polysaccharide deacetylase family protein n=1 Tax=Polaribacter sp. ALD11 TaxID=2058137 RepID=UPI000C318D54|nr:polysaccharide deacetylase family protein [Polaribacter sp. ALD11]AUC86445.1 hypothetical protein CW731_14665 [Polaribacter sp. ALD11]
MRFKELFFKISFIYNFIPLKLLMKLSGKKNIYPFYHIVNDTNGLTKHLYTAKNKIDFIKDLKYFKKHFNSISLPDLIKKNDSKNYRFLLTFDDGLKNFFTTVAPILLKEKIFAINFLNSNFIDNKELFFRFKANLLINEISKQKLIFNQKAKLNQIIDKPILSYLKNATYNDDKKINKIAEILNFSFSEFLEKEKPYLSTKQINDLINKGFYFGGHSKSHPYYANIDFKDQYIETLESVNYIQKKFNLKYKFFSFPFSDNNVSKKFFKKMNEENIITFGTAGLKDDTNILNHYQRIPMEYNSKYSAETIIKGELIYYILKKIFKKNEIVRL